MFPKITWSRYLQFETAKIHYMDEGPKANTPLCKAQARSAPYKTLLLQNFSVLCLAKNGHLDLRALGRVCVLTVPGVLEELSEQQLNGEKEGCSGFFRGCEHSHRHKRRVRTMRVDIN